MNEQLQKFIIDKSNEYSADMSECINYIAGIKAAISDPDILKAAGLVKVEDIIKHIEDAEILIPVEMFFNTNGEHITKRQYGKVLIDLLCKELRNKFLPSPPKTK